MGKYGFLRVRQNVGQFLKVFRSKHSKQSHSGSLILANICIKVMNYLFSPTTPSSTYEGANLTHSIRNPQRL